MRSRIPTNWRDPVRQKKKLHEKKKITNTFCACIMHVMLSALRIESSFNTHTISNQRPQNDRKYNLCTINNNYYCSSSRNRNTNSAIQTVRAKLRKAKSRTKRNKMWWIYVVRVLQLDVRVKVDCTCRYAKISSLIFFFCFFYILLKW